MEKAENARKCKKMQIQSFFKTSLEELVNTNCAAIVPKTYTLCEESTNLVSGT